jgi:hypothetical protein
MSWKSPPLLDRDVTKPDVLGSFLREIHTRVKFGSFTWNPDSVPANSVLETTLTSASVTALTGLRTGMSIHLTPPSSIDDSIDTLAYVAADDSLTVRLKNTSGSPVDIGETTWRFHGVVI